VRTATGTTGTHLLLGLAEGGVDQVDVIRVGGPAGEGDLAWMGAQARRPLDEQHLRPVVAGTDQDQHGRGPATGSGTQ